MRCNLVGMRFNHLTVVKPLGSDKQKHKLWECKCDCGTVTIASTSDLRSGHKKSCGCIKHKSNAIDLKGQRFGMLTVVKRVGTTKDRKAIWQCKCDCGKSTTVRSVDLKSGNTKSCGCLGNNYAMRNLMQGGFWNGKVR